ncbi:MAG TPA: hypothetical protein VK459_07080, partial [Polyangiaceae bacterium]|nr:hypothetical protein [Polyangiaceae bacterium]
RRLRGRRASRKENHRYVAADHESRRCSSIHFDVAPLEEINTVFNRMRRGDIHGRVVLRLA